MLNYRKRGYKVVAIVHYILRIWTLIIAFAVEMRDILIDF